MKGKILIGGTLLVAFVLMATGCEKKGQLKG